MEQLRRELRAEIVAAAQRGNQALDQAQRAEEEVVAVRRRLDAGGAGLAGSRSAGRTGGRRPCAGAGRRAGATRLRPVAAGYRYAGDAPAARVGCRRRGRLRPLGPRRARRRRAGVPAPRGRGRPPSRRTAGRYGAEPPYAPEQYGFGPGRRGRASIRPATPRHEHDRRRAGTPSGRRGPAHRDRARDHPAHRRRRRAGRVGGYGGAVRRPVDARRRRSPGPGRLAAPRGAHGRADRPWAEPADDRPGGRVRRRPRASGPTASAVAAGDRRATRPTTGPGASSP